MTAPVFSLCYTSVRADAVKSCVQLWVSRAARPELVEIVLTHDAGDEATRRAMLDVVTESALGICPAKVSCHEQPILPGSCVNGWNLAASKSSGHVLMCISDDFIPMLKWDHALMNLPGIGPHWVSAEAVVRVFDGYTRDLCTLPILTRRRYNKMGNALTSNYLSMFVDTELGARAIMDGVLIDAPHLFFEHRHCDNNKRARDGVDENHGGQHRYKHGELLYKSRQAQGFPIDTGPNAKHYLLKTTGEFQQYAAFILADKADLCLRESMERLHQEGVRSFFLVIPEEQWDGRKTPAEDITKVQSVAEEISKLKGAKVQCQTLSSAPFRATMHNPAELECAMRNAILDIIRENHYYHVLIVNGNVELWQRGMLEKIDRLAAGKNPMAITARHIPVVGGFPVEDCKDKVLVYLRADGRFEGPRSPYPCTIEHVDHSMVCFNSASEDVTCRLWTQIEQADIPVSLHSRLDLTETSTLDYTVESSVEVPKPARRNPIFIQSL